MPGPQVTVKIKCKLGWQLVTEYDNSDNHNTKIEREVTITKSKSVKGRTYTKTINDKTREEAEKIDVKASASVTWGPVSASVDAGYETSKVLKDYVSSTTEVSSEEEINESSTETVKFEVGPGDRLYLYQQTFSGPGIFCATTTTSVSSRKKTSADDKDIYIEVVSRPIEFICGIDVHYGDKETDAPDNRVREWTGKSDDINYGMSGKYVWLVPQYTTDTTKAATSFEIRIQSPCDDNYKDLAAGAGGEYRYIATIRDQRTAAKVTQLALVRDNNPRESEAVRGQLGSTKAWFGATRDINWNRKGTYLWLLWKVY